jgi:hypothetical protein
VSEYDNTKQNERASRHKKQNFAQTAIMLKKLKSQIPVYNNGVHIVNHPPGCSKVAVFLPAMKSFRTAIYWKEIYSCFYNLQGIPDLENNHAAYNQIPGIICTSYQLPELKQMCLERCKNTKQAE